jgi:DNA polymerase III alpha subunit (gram-positive type)
MKYNQKCLVFDLESTHLNLLTTIPWQNAWAVMQNKKILDEVDRHIWHENLKLSEGAAIVTRFNYDRYKSLALPSKQVAKEFADLFYDPSYFIVGHNIFGFDLPVMQTWLKMEGLWLGWKDVPKRALDTMLLLRMYHNGYKPDKENLLGSQLKEIGKPPRGSKKSSLGAGCKEFGIDYDPSLSHDAKYDVRKTGELLNSLTYKLDLIE